jgi:hypothetical protein
MSQGVEVVRIATVDPTTEQEIGTAYYGVVASDDSGYQITRSAASLGELRDEVGDLTDPRSLWEHVESHHPDIGPYTDPS